MVGILDFWPSFELKTITSLIFLRCDQRKSNAYTPVASQNLLTRIFMTYRQNKKAPMNWGFLSKQTELHYKFKLELVVVFSCETY
jgi:hypothetical protein